MTDKQYDYVFKQGLKAIKIKYGKVKIKDMDADMLHEILVYIIGRQNTAHYQTQLKQGPLLH